MNNNYILYNERIAYKITNAPIGAWKCNFLPFYYDRPTEQPTNKPTN